MAGSVQSAVVDSAFKEILNVIDKCIKNHQWQSLFVDTGKFFTSDAAELEIFKADLAEVFSSENMAALSQEMRDKSGYEFRAELNSRLRTLMAKYEIPALESEQYIHHFMEVIIHSIKENDSDKAMEMFLGELRSDENNYYEHILSRLTEVLKEVKTLDEKKIESFSTDDIDMEIRRKARLCGLNLDFFESNDEQFETRFEQAINNETIFVVGRSREETSYRIMHELTAKYASRYVLVIRSQESWDMLCRDNEISGYILLPLFCTEEIQSVRNNTNIFIYGEDEPCYASDKLVMRPRTRNNIIAALEHAGMNLQDAEELVSKTHGLYAIMKKHLFNIAEHQKPVWTENCSDTVMAAFLCGKWTESDGDKEAFKELAGKPYDECKKELINYTRGENPFIVKMNNRMHPTGSMQLACADDAWLELDYCVTDELWEKFSGLFFKALTQLEPIFELPFEKHFTASLHVDQSGYSQELKQGMIRTFTMRAYCCNHPEAQQQADALIKKILDFVTDMKWRGYISQYLPALGEASPEAVMCWLEAEADDPSGMRELFEANDGDFMTSRHYYVNILHTVEQLLCQAEYAPRAVDWLWKMHSLEMKCSLGNTPHQVLGEVFCAWAGNSSLSVEGKVACAQKGIESYDNAWDVICDCLPGASWSTSCGSLSKPRYRMTDEPEPPSPETIREIYNDYLNICIDAAGLDANRWKKLLGKLCAFSEGTLQDALGIMVAKCQFMSDIDKITVKNELRRQVYRHRFYIDTKIDDERIAAIYERFTDQIEVKDKVHDYLYLFEPEYEFPLLHPVPFKNNAEYMTVNAARREEEIREKMNWFIERKYDIGELVDLVIDKYRDSEPRLGGILAQFYCHDVYDEDIFALLLDRDVDGKYVYGYVRRFVNNGSMEWTSVMEAAKSRSQNADFIARLLSMQPINTLDTALIARESEGIKRAYWGNTNKWVVFERATVETYIWALDECCHYGNSAVYLELLYYAKDKLTTEQLYEYMVEVPDPDESILNDMSRHYFGEILDILQTKYSSDGDRYVQIASMEIKFYGLIDWGQMKCLQAVMKRSPKTYADLVHIIYKTDTNDKEPDAKTQRQAELLLGLYWEAKFCPAEENGQVKYEDLRNWVDDFKKLLAEQNQASLYGHLLGGLLPYSPIGDDGYMPCEAVRKLIEEDHDEELDRAFITSEFNKRGVYIADGGHSEMNLSESYKANANAVRGKYPHTAKLYDRLSESYWQEARQERQAAEDGW